MSSNVPERRKMRDAQAAVDIMQKAELGYFEIEFTMYGCAYLENDMVYYKVSSEAADIYDFAEKSLLQDIFASNIETYTWKQAVPFGFREDVALEVKKTLARKLRAWYPKDFLYLLQNVAIQISDNAAAPVLWNAVETVEGLFETEKLNALESMMRYAYSCRHLEKGEFEQLNAWLKKERKNMTDDIISKSTFEKTMCGFLCIDNHKETCFCNAQKSSVYPLLYKYEENGSFVTPLYEKKYWYDYNFRMKELTDYYKRDIRAIYSEAYIEGLKTIRYSQRELSAETFMQMLDDTKMKYGELAFRTLKRYGYRWGILY